MTKWITVIPILVLVIFVSALAEDTRLLREPAINGKHVAFVYANDIWLVAREGGVAQRVTTHKGSESNPAFSPDGKWIAFSGEYDGNTDVFIVPTEGGEPKRLTYHPAPDVVRGWTNDGGHVMFASNRTNVPIQTNRLWSIPVEGGMPEALPMKMANRGSYSPEGKRMAYVRVQEAFQAWRHYRGGRTTRIWLIDLGDYSIEKIPQQDNSNDTFPCWLGYQVYFLSDRNHSMNLFSYDTNTKKIVQLTHHSDFDIRSASGGDGAIVYEQAGYLHVFQIDGGTSRKLNIEVRGDMPWRRPHYSPVASLVSGANLSPKGKRAVFSARGDILTVPVEKGDYRNLSSSPGVHDRVPAWSPDGRFLAWFSDAGGEYQLMIRDQKGVEDPRAISLEHPSYYYDTTWSPDSKKVAFTDKALQLWYADLESDQVVRVDKDTYDHPERTISPVWSPDSKWLAYSKRLASHMHAIYLYSLEEKKVHQLTDGLSDAISPAWDLGGKYLYFLASTDYALSVGWLDMSSLERPITRGAYLVVLSGEDKSPFLPQSDEEEVEAQEKVNDEASDSEDAIVQETAAEGQDEQERDGKADGGAKKEKKLVSVKIDFDGIAQRILAIDVPVRNYQELKAGAEGTILFGEIIRDQPGFTLHRYSITKQKSETLLTKVNAYWVSADGEKCLYRSRDDWAVVGTKKKPKAGDGKLKTGKLKILVDPEQEWKQIYREAWRINRDYFYDEKMHGADWNEMYKKYEPFLEHVRHRSDLSYLLSLLIGELAVGHSRAGGGQMVRADRVSVGLLGADYAVEGLRYKFERIYTGENWNPSLRAPLTAPGLNIREGEFLLEVSGVELFAPMNVYQLFEDTAGRQITFRVNDSPEIEGSRLVTVVPVSSESTLRTVAWVEDNRRKVDELSAGRLAYVYLPNTAYSGFVNFNRYYFAQQSKKGVIIDERFNGGGLAADYFVDLMNRPVLSYWATRDGKEFTTPAAAIFGPKVMIINEYAGSGGDALPYYFRKRGVGTLVGKTTWGGLVGHHGGAGLIDGGGVSSPNLAMYNTEGNWDVENIGVAPDVEVEMLPAQEIAGKDPQLEQAVKEGLRLLSETQRVRVPRPEPIDRVSPEN